jgi:hypothetical protein
MLLKLTVLVDHILILLCHLQAQAMFLPLTLMIPQVVMLLSLTFPLQLDIQLTNITQSRPHLDMSHMLMYQLLMDSLNTLNQLVSQLLLKDLLFLIFMKPLKMAQLKALLNQPQEQSVVEMLLI